MPARMAVEAPVAPWDAMWEVERASWAQPQGQRPIPATQTNRRRCPSSPIPREKGMQGKGLEVGTQFYHAEVVLAPSASGQWSCVHYAAQFTVDARFLAPDASAAVLGGWNRLLKPRKPSH